MGRCTTTRSRDLHHGSSINFSHPSRQINKLVAVFLRKVILFISNITLEKGLRGRGARERYNYTDSARSTSVKGKICKISTKDSLPEMRMRKQLSSLLQATIMRISVARLDFRQRDDPRIDRMSSCSAIMSVMIPARAGIMQQLALLGAKTSSHLALDTDRHGRYPRHGVCLLTEIPRLRARRECRELFAGWSSSRQFVE